MSTVDELLGEPVIVVEFRDDDDWIQIRARFGHAPQYRFRHHSEVTWSSWQTAHRFQREEWSVLPARLVPIGEADLDPNTRGEL